MKRTLVRLALLATLSAAALSAAASGAKLAVQHINGADNGTPRIVAVQHINGTTVAPDVQHIN